MEDPIFSFLVDYADIDQDDLLSLRFNEYPEETIEQANEVLRSMCAEYTDVQVCLATNLFSLTRKSKPFQVYVCANGENS